MENLNVVVLTIDEVKAIDGGKSVAYYVGYAAGEVVCFVSGFLSYFM
jgi:hypothetical protein